MKFIKYIIFLLALMVVTNSFAYKPKRTNSFSSYNEHTNEIGYAINLSYLKYEKTYAPQLHLHYSKYLTDFFSLGLGYGGIYDKHFHNTVDLDLSFRVYKMLIFTIKPGLAYKNDRGYAKFLYSMGFEMNYEIKVTEDMHIGPMFELDILQDDVNYLAGFHMGFTF